MKMIDDARRISKLLAACLAICGIATTPAWAQSGEDELVSEDTGEEAAELDRVVITGSRIRRTAIEGPSPVTVITAEDIQREGFTTVYEALTSLTQISGDIQDESFAGGFTQNANAIDLRGLGPGRLLVLLNGRRATDYPLPFNGQSNIVNLGSLPTAIVERIELLSGGASAIYGSDAVAGVINIVLRKDVGSNVEISARVGGTSDGGGSSRRVQIVGGFLRDKLSISYALEAFNRHPINAKQRDFMDSTADNPTLEPGEEPNLFPSLVALDTADIDGDGLQFLDPAVLGRGDCGGIPELTYTSDSRGFFCGQPDLQAFQSIRNSDDNYSAYTYGTYEFSTRAELFASLNYWNSDAEFNVGLPLWVTNGEGSGLILNTQTGGLVLGQRFFQPSEIGSPGIVNSFEEEAVDVAFGIRGTIFSDLVEYELTYSHAEYDVERDRRLFKEELVDDFFYGQPLGVVSGFPVHDMDLVNFFSPITPEQYNELSGINTTTADSSNDIFTAVLTGDLFSLQLPGGPVQYAAVAEWGSQDYDIQLDDRLKDGTLADPDEPGNGWWGFTGSGGGGERDRYAAGLELRLPVASTLLVSAAARYDNYDDITNVDGALTYNLGVEYRPTDRILLRASRATSFRAPDMHYVFADPSGFFTTITDEFLCRRDEPDTPFSQCTQSGYGIQGAREGNPRLEEEEGDSWGFGFVVEPIDNLTLTADFYKIELQGVVNDISLGYLIETEADCRLGETLGGESVDPNSSECQEVSARIERAPVSDSEFSERIISIETGPINRTFLGTSGIDASLRYSWDTDRFGSFAFETQWSHVLDYDVQEFAGDPVENIRDDLQNFQQRSRIRGSLTWGYKDLTTTLFGIRLGSVPNWGETGRIGPQMVYNLTANYRVNNNFDIDLVVQNLMDENPPRDGTFDTYPYFWFNYTGLAYGREYFLQANYNFDY
ncbi:TonB-dependent receptor domain-containing protein [Lentisalinibacter sediminis]|uniref:TonB-dependent receptor domain-containing protein n=1 Tax=Lentisalinibacter sediminis TaxID=2992237 RepID=UPI0038660EF1